MLKLPYLKLLWISVALLFITSIAFSPVSAIDQQTAIVQAQQYADQAQGYVQQAQQNAQQSSAAQSAALNAQAKVSQVQQEAHAIQQFVNQIETIQVTGGNYSYAITQAQILAQNTQQYVLLAKRYAEEAQQAVQRPVPSFFTSTTSGNAPLPVQFQDRSSNNPTSWSWDFGDGTRSSGQTASHVYSSPGYFTATLTATNSAGSSTASRTITVTQSAPIVQRPAADFSVSSTTGTAPLSVQFQDRSSNNPTSWSWDFGDGTRSSGQTASHVYSSPGYFTVTMTVTNSAGSGTTSRTITVTQNKGESRSPIADFSTIPSSGSAPLNPVTLVEQLAGDFTYDREIQDDMSIKFLDTTKGGDVKSWSWDFGDGGTSSDRNPSHHYTNYRTYTVKLTVVGITGTNTKITGSYSSDSVMKEIGVVPVEKENVGGKIIEIADNIDPVIKVKNVIETGIWENWGSSFISTIDILPKNLIKWFTWPDTSKEL